MGTPTDSPGHFESTRKRAAFPLAVRGDLGVRGNTTKRISCSGDFDHDRMAARKASALESDPKHLVQCRRCSGRLSWFDCKRTSFSASHIMSCITATGHGPRSFGYLAEPALPLLATLWGASYAFIKLGVESIPPVTLIAARTTIAAVVLLRVLQWRRIATPTDLAVWRRFLFQACHKAISPQLEARRTRYSERRARPNHSFTSVHAPAFAPGNELHHRGVPSRHAAKCTALSTPFCSESCPSLRPRRLGVFASEHCPAHRRSSRARSRSLHQVLRGS